MRRADASVMFATTAGPRRGFGHLVRCGVLADALRVRRLAVLRDASVSTTAMARRLGFEVRSLSTAFHGLQSLLVVDDPSLAHANRWVRRARRLSIPVVSIHDGAPAWPAADLVIDGSAVWAHPERPNPLTGPAFAILRPAGAHRGPFPKRKAHTVVVALGGGIHVRTMGARVAAAIVRRIPSARVDVAAGFTGGHPPRLPEGCRWISATNGLSGPLSTAAVSVVSGGVTMYEACALGTPTVAVPVVPSQQAAIDAVVRAGAALTVNAPAGQIPDQIADLVCYLLQRPTAGSTLGRHARQLVDGRGTERVIARLARILDRSWRTTHHAVA